MNGTIPVLFLIYMEEVIALHFIIPVVQEEIQCSVLQVKVSMVKLIQNMLLKFIIFILCSPLVAAYASTGREGGLRSKSTLAYLEGGRVRNLIFFAYVIMWMPPNRNP